MARNRRSKQSSSVRGKGPAADRSWSWRREGLLVAVLLIAVFLAYQPVWNGGFIWDDDGHVTKPALRSWLGLYRIWFEVGATQQYYPLLHSAFWFQCKLFGDQPMGYHLVTILLHGMAAVMVALVLRRLAVPGAWLAAAVFALHPVCVESVAWITEQKNTLSAVLYLGAMLVYLHFDETRKVPLYLAALGLFALALLSKTVTATLPGALLVIFWWQRGHLSWQRDVLPTVPFFSLGAVAGVFTAWVERKLIGAEGAAFEMSLLDRGLVAGRVIWFYLGKLVWPFDLLFFYPRWQIDAGVWWQYLFPAATLALVAVLWQLRRRWRAPLAGFLFFAGTLFPVLGFFNVYPFIFSFVADHFQYLASLGVITLASAGAALALKRWGFWGRPVGHALCLAVLAILAGLTARQCRMYADVETLYRTTIAGNPTCWIAYNNLAVTLSDRNQTDEAIADFQKALTYNPSYMLAHNNIGLLLARLERFDEAMVHYQKAMVIAPTYVPTYNNIGMLLVDTRQPDKAMAWFQKALQYNPDNEDAHINLANLLADQRKFDEAIAHYRKALARNPNIAGVHINLANTLARQGKLDEAIAQYHSALECDPNSASTHIRLADLLASRKQFDEAIAQYQMALSCDPNAAEAYINLANVLASRGDSDQAIVHYQKAIQVAPASVSAYNNIGTLLLKRGQTDEAIAHYQRALQIDPGNDSVRQNLQRALLERTRRMKAGPP